MANNLREILDAPYDSGKKLRNESFCLLRISPARPSSTYIDAAPTESRVPELGRAQITTAAACTMPAMNGDPGRSRMPRARPRMLSLSQALPQWRFQDGRAVVLVLARRSFGETDGAPFAVPNGHWPLQ
ncbi:hypothetical protein MRX96_020479 [Rhipicephalus microplus]